MTPKQSQQLRSLPAVDDLLSSDRARQWCDESPRSSVTTALRSALEQLRKEILNNGDQKVPTDLDHVLDLAHGFLKRQSTPSLRRVINATGVVLHTGLGRAPLGKSAIEAIVRGAPGYANLELDLETGKRGRRQDHVSGLLERLTGAEAAAVVNNNAAAVVLIMRALCEDREVIVSRGQLVEIGGSFRMPEIMTAAGVRLREVGTTNRTRIADYRAAVTENSVALLRVHHSNFKIVGFTHQPTPAELVDCAHQHDLIAIDDLGSGAMLDPESLGLPAEPHVAQSVAAGFDVICFSGDKLLGGPQCGIILGRKDLVDRIERHPLMRSYRLDKLVLLALEATLRHYGDRDDAVANIPTLNMLSLTTDQLADRAGHLERMLSAAMPDESFLVGSDTSVAGGGSLPGEGLETVVIRWRPSFDSVDAIIRKLREFDTPVIARIRDDAVVFDLRTLRDDEYAALVDAVVASKK